MNRNFTALEFKWGIIFFIITILWMLFEKWMGWHDENIADHAKMTSIIAIPSVLIYVFALLEKRKNHYNGVMTWRQGFMCGMMITLFLALLSPIGQLIFHKLISPGYFSNVIEYAVNSQGMDRQAMESYFNLRSYIVQSMVGTIAMGIILSALIALFVRRQGPPSAIPSA